MERSKLYAVVAAQAFDSGMWNPDCIVRVVETLDKAMILAGEGGHYACELAPVAIGEEAIDAGKALREHPHAARVDLGDGAGQRVKEPEEIAASIARDHRVDGDASSGPYRIGLADIRNGIRSAIRRERADVNTAGLALSSPDEIAETLIADVMKEDDTMPKAMIRERVIAAVKAERGRDYDALHEARRQTVIAEQARMAAASKRPTYQPKRR